MTARQQIARLVPVALLVVLAIAGLRGAVPVPRWNGPLRAYGVAIGLALEVVLGALLVITVRREGAAMRAAALLPASQINDDVTVPGGLRFALKWVLGCGMAAIGAVLIINLHLHFFTRPPRPLRLRSVPYLPPPRPAGGGAGSGSSLHIPFAAIMYGLLIAVLVAALAISIVWSARQRRAALAPEVPSDLAADSEGLREAVESGRAALATDIDDARAAIIACYVAMEDSLALRGTERGVADTPDELLARAVKSGLVKGGAARWLTRLFYEARFSSHPLGPSQRDAASLALDELADELVAKAVS
jgi:hypothetical protein